jgi:glycosyltransferase involved in cell wall biosynthesis
VRVIAFTRYGREAAATRQRLLQYIPALKAAGIDVRYEPLLGDEYVRSLAAGRSFSRVDVVRAYLGRFRALVSGPKAEIVWIYAENFPFLPGWFERLALGRSGAVIYDFDDAFFHNYDSSPKPLVRRLLGRKLHPLMRRAAACCCGNAYLEEYASRFCRRTMIVPTVVDTDAYRPRPSPRAPGEPLVIGWIGSPTTWRYLRPLLPLLQDLVRERGVRVRVVGAGPAAEADRFPGLDLVEWTESAEVADVQAMDIGIMPLPDETWALGKSGYKLIQYMGCGLPVVASPVGVNAEIVRHGETGFHAATIEQWGASLRQLLDDPDLRLRMGSGGRRRAEEEYSLKVHAPRLIELFKTVAAGPASND